MSNVKQEYLVNKSGEIISPITSINSIYDGGGKSLLDLFYPIGTYYETSNANFNPNTEWGGTWVQDSAGRSIIAYDSSQTEFNTIGKTGGSKTHRHNFRVGIGFWYGSAVGEATSASPAGAYKYSSSSWSGWESAGFNTTARRNNGTQAGYTLESASVQQATGDTDVGSSLNPYVTAYRWHRTA